MLTGIYNRQIEEHIRDCSVYVIFDIDHFKTVNDTYGHAKGDEILKSVAQIVKKHVRINDYLYRYGGDEFCIAFTIVGKDIVKKRLNTIQEEIRNTVKLPNPNHTITLSIGMIENTNNEKAEELRKKADEALYESKRNGRDQITEYSEYIKKLG